MATVPCIDDDRSASSVRVLVVEDSPQRSVGLKHLSDDSIMLLFFLGYWDFAGPALAVAVILKTQKIIAYLSPSTR